MRDVQITALNHMWYIYQWNQQQKTVTFRWYSYSGGIQATPTPTACSFSDLDFKVNKFSPSSLHVGLLMQTYMCTNSAWHNWFCFFGFLNKREIEKEGGEKERGRGGEREIKRETPIKINIKVQHKIYIKWITEAKMLTFYQLYVSLICAS